MNRKDSGGNGYGLIEVLSWYLLGGKQQNLMSIFYINSVTYTVHLKSNETPILKN
jgi:hypothetical protein